MSKSCPYTLSCDPLVRELQRRWLADRERRRRDRRAGHGAAVSGLRCYWTGPTTPNTTARGR